MNSNSKPCLVICVSLFVGVNLAGGTALAASDEPSASGIEEILVTARKRTENLSEVPMTISVLGSG